MTPLARLERSAGLLQRRRLLPHSVSPRTSSRSKHGQEQNTRKRIGLFGLFGTGNSGNDGSLEAMLQFVRQVRPDAEITCICAAHRGAADRVAQNLNTATIPLGLPPPERRIFRILDRLALGLPRRSASLVHTIRQARKLNALIIPGTGILDDFGGSPFGMPLALLAWCFVAKLRGAWVGFVSIGAGPIQHPLSRRLMKSAASLADYRSYRDTVSKEFMESIGFDTRKDAIYPDIAFKLPVPPPAPAKSSDGRLVVGIGVMTYLGWRNDWTRGAPIYRAYLEKITRFAIWLLDCGHTVRVLMGDTNDRRAVRDVVARIKEARPNLTDGRLLFAEITSLHDLMGQIGGIDVVVATRFHNIVCALKLGKPSISIGYADKNDALMAEMGLGELCQHIEDFDVDRLIAQFGQLVADRARYERVLRRANLAIRERLDHQDALLAASLP